MKKFILMMISGMKSGALIYLLCVLLNTKGINTSKELIINVLLMSALCGGMTIIFNIERFSFLTLLLIHYIGTFIIVSIAMICSGYWENVKNGDVLISFTIIYIYVCLHL